MKKKTIKKKKVLLKGAQKKETKNFVYSYYSMVFSLGCILLILTGVLQIVKRNASFPPCANTITCAKDLSGNISNSTQGMYEGKIVHVPQPVYFAQAEQVLGSHAVLGATTGSKHIYVDLSQQRLYAFQGSTLVFNDSVATGKWNLTPTGTFQIWIKLQATLMAGGEGATSYYLPNVPWTMYFYNAKIGKDLGYSLHGEYWYDPNVGLGKPESHGCVNMRISDAKALYDWVNPSTTGFTTYSTNQDPGTLVTIYGTTPNSGLVGSSYYNNNVSFDAGDQI